jgi:hypothetical protein
LVVLLFERTVSSPSHPLEDYLLKTFQLDQTGLNRLGFFLLAHIVIDTRLIALALFKAVSEQGGVPLSRIQMLADDAANGTFGVHLDKVRAHLTVECTEIAEELNKARNALLHWNSALDQAAHLPTRARKELS